MPPVNMMLTPNGRVPVIPVAWLCFQEARPTVQGVFTLRLLTGWALTVAWPDRGSARPLVAGVAAWTCVVMSIYLLNGVSDQREDRINGSRRPIASGRLASTTAGRVAWGLAAAGVLAGFAVSVPLGFLALTGVAVGWLYCVPSWRLKRRSVGAAVAALAGIGLTYYAGAVIATTPPVGVPPPVGVDLLVFGGGLSLWAALVGSTTKDLPDEAGDRSVGARSWLIVWGERRFRLVVSVIALLIGTGFGVGTVRLAPDLLPVAGALFAGAVAVAALLVAPVWRPGCRVHRRSPYRAFMATQYATHLGLLSREFAAIVGS
jgi:4-hydroxybenzoate polyprenyltransferase